MTDEYKIPTCPATIMCDSCKGIGRLGGSMYVTESCGECKGTGMVQREVVEE